MCSSRRAISTARPSSATKAVTQVAGHLYRIAYFGSFAGGLRRDDPLVGVCALRIGLAFAGTSLAATVLMRMTDDGFRMWSRRVTIGVSAHLSGARTVAGGGAVNVPSPRRKTTERGRATPSPVFR